MQATCNANVEFVSAGVAQAKADPVTLLQCQVMCPHCEQHYVDKGRWAKFNHYKHKCSNCAKMFHSEKAYVGVESAGAASVADDVW